jgi:hypothetical protein
VAILEDDVVFPSVIERERLDSPEVDNARSMDPTERRRIQLAFELVDRLAYQV